LVTEIIPSGNFSARKNLSDFYWSLHSLSFSSSEQKRKRRWIGEPWGNFTPRRAPPSL